MLALSNPIDQFWRLRAHKPRPIHQPSLEVGNSEIAGLTRAEAGKVAVLIVRFLNALKKRVGGHRRVDEPKFNTNELYNNLPCPRNESSLLRELVVLKLKSRTEESTWKGGNTVHTLRLEDGMSFVDATVEHVAKLNTMARVDIPLVLLSDSRELRTKAKNGSNYVRILPLRQLASRREDDAEVSTLCSQTPAESTPSDRLNACIGVFQSLEQSGLLKQLLKEGRRFLFVSSSDNPGATIEPKLLYHFLRERATILEEVVSGTEATHLRNQGQVDGVLSKQEPHSTGSFWINLHAMKRHMEKLDSVTHTSHTSPPPTSTMFVPPERALSVRSPMDLLLLRSDIYSLEDGVLVLDEQRSFSHLPTIRLDGRFNKVHEFDTRLRWTPKMLELDDLTVSGNVYFGRDVTLKGTVIINAKDGHRLDIPDGCVLKDCLVSGNLISTEI